MRARLWAGFFLLLALGGAHAAPPHIKEHLSEPRQAGAGRFTWFGLTIYEAELWVGRQGYRPAAPSAAPFVLELRYARALSGARIAEASAEQMKKIKAGTELQRKAWLARMLEIFPDVQQGSRITGTYLPDSGARFYLNGKALASVPDPAFARAFFGIWLDPASTAPVLRNDLLRRAAPQ